MILAIDSGTTGTTVLIIDAKGRVAAQAYAELPQHYPQPGWVEHNPQQILAVTRLVIKKALSSGRITASRIRAIGITNQRETTLLWDRKTGKPLANAIVWQCRRTSALCQRLIKQKKAAGIRAKTGLVVDAYFSGTKLQWLLDHAPSARKRALRGELAFGTVDSWLIWHLTGGQVHATDFTNASRTMLYNIHSQRWDATLLKMMAVPESVLPQVKPPSGFFGKISSRFGILPAGIPITGVAGDQQASMVGHGCLSSGTAKNTYGTGCFLLLHTGSKAVASRNGLLTTLVCGSSSAAAYALEGSVFIAGAAIQWLRDSLQTIGRAAETETIARRVKDTGGVYVVPAFVGLGAPYWDMQARGAVIGLTRGSGRDVIVRATLESLAYQTRDVVEAMEKDSGISLHELRVDGGAAQNDWLMQFQADVLGIPVIRPAMVANTGKGAALLAGIGVGLWKPGEVKGLAAASQRVFKPRMDNHKRQKLYAGWKEAVARVRDRPAHD